MKHTMGEQLIAIEESLCELEDAVDFMEGFEGYEDEDAIERRKRKYGAIERMDSVLSEMKEVYSKLYKEGKCDGSYRVCDGEECESVIIQGYVVNEENYYCEHCADKIYQKDGKIQGNEGVDDMYFTEWWQG